jgi:hypothetical protein
MTNGPWQLRGMVVLEGVVIDLIASRVWMLPYCTVVGDCPVVVMVVVTTALSPPHLVQIKMKGPNDNEGRASSSHQKNCPVETIFCL